MQKQILLVVLLLVALVLSFFSGVKWGSRNSLDDHRNPTTVYATYEGGQVLEAEVINQIKDELKIMDRNSYQLKKRIVEDIILKRTGKNLDTAQNQTNDGATESDPEFKKFLISRGLDLKKMKPLDQKNVIQNYRFSEANEARKRNRQASLDSTHIRWKIPITFFDPLVAAKPGFLAPLGPTSAKAQVIVFANYQCPFCSEAFRKIEQFRINHPNDIQIHFRFAFNDPENSFVFQSALAGACANEQKKFWEFSEALMQKNPSNDADLVALAEAQQLDSKKFETCLKNRKFASDIQNDRSQAESIKIDRPPVLIINGHLFFAQEPMENLETVLTQFL